MDRRVIVALGLFVCAGCATSTRGTFTDRFIRHGTPSVDLGGRPLDQRAAERAAPRLEATAPSSVARMSAGVGALESFDRGLQRALALLAVRPTAERHIDVARAYRRVGIMDHAYDYLTRSLTVNGPNAAVYEELARLWRDWGNPELGLADAHRAVYYAPESPAARNTLGTLLYRLGNAIEAEAQFKAAVALDPNAWYAFANLCHVSLAQGRTRDAIAQCRHAQALRRESPDTARQRSRK